MADGSNYDDIKDYRPKGCSKRARYKKPLSEAGLTKAEIRSLEEAESPQLGQAVLCLLVIKISMGQR